MLRGPVFQTARPSPTLRSGGAVVAVVAAEPGVVVQVEAISEAADPVREVDRFLGRGGVDVGQRQRHRLPHAVAGEPDVDAVEVLLDFPDAFTVDHGGHAAIHRDEHLRAWPVGQRCRVEDFVFESCGFGRASAGKKDVFVELDRDGSCGTFHDVGLHLSIVFLPGRHAVSIRTRSGAATRRAAGGENFGPN
ncbi:hypothetical protein ACFPRL_34355 [Pseudoclavibacter helvolus]